MKRKLVFLLLGCFCLLCGHEAWAESCGQRVWNQYARRDAAHGAYTRTPVSDGGYWRDPALLPLHKSVSPAPPPRWKTRSKRHSRSTVQKPVKAAAMVAPATRTAVKTQNASTPDSMYTAAPQVAGSAASATPAKGTVSDSTRSEDNSSR